MSKMMFKNKLVVEVGKDEMKFLKGRFTRNRFNILDYGTISLEDINFGEGLSLMKDRLGENFLKTKDVYLVLKSEDFDIESFTIPKVTQRDKTDLINNILENKESFDAGKKNINIIYCQPLKTDETMERVMFIMIEKERADEYERIFKDVGYNLKTIDVAFNTLHKLFAYSNRLNNNLILHKKNIMIVDLSKNFLEVVVFEDSDLKYINSLEIDEDILYGNLSDELYDLEKLIEMVMEHYYSVDEESLSLLVLQGSYRGVRDLSIRLKERLNLDNVVMNHLDIIGDMDFDLCKYANVFGGLIREDCRVLWI